MTVLTVAAVQSTPVLLDRDATVDLLVEQVAAAAGQGAELVVFGEAVVPGYPDWVWRRRPWQDRELFRRLHDQAVDVPGPVTRRLGQAAREAGVRVAVGVTERVPSGTLHNSLVHLDERGEVVGVHRKLVVTGGERTVWGPGTGPTLATVRAAGYRIGGLICWENLMPLARAALWQQGVDVFLAPTWDDSEVWLPTLQHIAREGAVFVVGTNSCLRGSDVPGDLPGAAETWGGDDDWMSRGGTAVVGPDGRVLAGPLWEKAGMLVARLDLEELVDARRQFDPVGHYARPDVLTLTVHGGGTTWPGGATAG